ncbi:hypothetical protein [uncultured Amnibacterium sp.]|uniref:hypothetical protein n=1 Tax=uncultured Amnibacterium sp. TaxID=1631851 RepID=UPI0035C990FE
MGSVQRLADRVARSTAAVPDEHWRDAVRPVLARHWPLADHDWHRRRQRSVAGGEREETDHQLTRYALLPDGRLVRATTWRSEAREPDGAVRAEPWQGEVRSLAARDIRVLDQRTRSDADRGAPGTWGTQPTGESAVPWPGAGIERLLKALLA